MNFIVLAINPFLGPPYWSRMGALFDTRTGCLLPSTGLASARWFSWVSLLWLLSHEGTIARAIQYPYIDHIQYQCWLIINIQKH